MFVEDVPSRHHDNAQKFHRRGHSHAMARTASSLADLTIVVPAKNEERLIGHFLASLAPTVSLIVVDASTDRTPDIVRHVVAPAAGGPVDLVRHGEPGFLYPARSPRLLRGAVEMLVAHYESVISNGRAALPTAS